MASTSRCPRPGQSQERAAPAGVQAREVLASGMGCGGAYSFFSPLCVLLLLRYPVQIPTPVGQALGFPERQGVAEGGGSHEKPEDPPPTVRVQAGTGAGHAVRTSPGHCVAAGCGQSMNTQEAKERQSPGWPFQSPRPPKVPMRRERMGLPGEEGGGDFRWEGLGG